MRPARRILPLLLCLAATLSAQLAQGPGNLDFSDSEPGQPPKGWMVPAASQGFPVLVAEQCSRPGIHCAVLRSEGAASAPFGNLMKYFDAAPYRGKQVRFRASVRVESPGAARAQLWLRVDLPNQQMGFFDNMGDRPILSPAWNAYEIAGDVAADARGIAIGMMLFGAGAAYLDNVSFEILGDVRPAQIVERSRPLAGRGLENLTAFARLYGYIRHFYPGNEAFRADWDALAIAGVPAVEAAADPAALARKLEDFFRPVAPAVRVFAASQSPPPKLDLGSGKQMISWKHTGFGTGNPQSTYKSERVTAGAPGGQLPAPFLADLGAGVKALVPLTLFVNEKVAPPGAATTRYTAADRATRIGDVIIAWNVFQHFYPYFGVVHTDWPKALATALQSAAADKDEKDFALTLRRLVAALKDGHGNVAPGPAGVPAPIAWDWVGDRLVVTCVPDPQGQPIAPGDAVLAIAGKPIAAALAETEALISGATPQWIRFRALNELGLGPLDQPLVLEIESFREPVERRTVTLKRKTAPAVEPRPDKVSDLKPGIVYVDLSRISDDDWKAALPKLESAKGIVFDLRGYPRVRPAWLTHLSEKPMTSAQWHIPLVTEPDGKNMAFTRGGEWQLAPAAPYLKAKRAILTDGRAISYAESCMGIVEYYHLAEIVGGPTAGTNGNVNPFRLPGGYTVVWTGMKVLKHDGSQHHGVGIKPTIPVARTRAGIAAGQDELLGRAIAAVE